MIDWFIEGIGIGIIMAITLGICLAIGIPIGLLLRHRDSAWCKNKGRQILRDGNIHNPKDFWNVLNSLNKLQKDDLEAADLLKKLRQLKEKMESI